MTETLLAYYADLNAKRTGPLHLADVPVVETVSLHKPTHRVPGDFDSCIPVQTNYEGTNWAYWCSRHEGGLHRPDAECSEHPIWV